ncbi:hypothetical protein ASF77_10510 [Massilia sp. Leaf139]|nr:hypothetical protein ASF77_10510 [Massilia sp. Leaf139]
MAAAFGTAAFGAAAFAAARVPALAAGALAATDLVDLAALPGVAAVLGVFEAARAGAGTAFARADAAAAAPFAGTGFLVIGYSTT